MSSSNPKVTYNEARERIAKAIETECPFLNRHDRLRVAGYIHGVPFDPGPEQLEAELSKEDAAAIINPLLRQYIKADDDIDVRIVHIGDQPDLNKKWAVIPLHKLAERITANVHHIDLNELAKGACHD